MKKNLLKSTVVVSIMTIISRVTGFLRDLVFAHIFGAAGSLDAFLVAFRIPNFLRRLFAEGAFSQSFVPVLSEYQEKKSHKEVQTFINRIAGYIAVTLFIVTVIVVLTTPWLIWFFAPGFGSDPSRYQLASSMLRITFPYLLFISLTAFISGILNSYGKFSIPAFTSSLLNFALIGAAIFLAPYFKQPVIALAWGVFIGGVAQLLFQIPFVKKINLMPRLEFSWHDPGVSRVLKLMLPAVFGVSVTQISLLADNFFASFLKAGSVSWLYYSDRLTSFPLGVFGVAIATVVLPHLSRKHAIKSQKDFSAALDWALRFIFIIAVPAMLGMALLANPILITLLQYGKFSAFDVAMTHKSLLGFALGIPGFMFVKILASGFYAKQNVKTPVRIAIISVIANVVLDVALIYPLAHAGLALATTLASTLNAALLLWALLRTKNYQPSSGWGKFFLQLTFASLAMTLLLWFCNTDLETWLRWSCFNRVFYLSLLLGGAVFIYLMCLWFSGIRLKHFSMPIE